MLLSCDSKESEARPWLVAVGVGEISLAIVFAVIFAVVMILPDGMLE